jgi:hypothetical protein
LFARRTGRLLRTSTRRRGATHRPQQPVTRRYPSYVRAATLRYRRQSGGTDSHAHLSTPFCQRNPPSASRPKGRRPNSDHRGAAGGRCNVATGHRSGAQRAWHSHPGRVHSLASRTSGASAGADAGVIVDKCSIQNRRRGVHKRKEASGDRLRSQMQILPGYMNSPERIRYCLVNAAECERAAVATALRTNVHAHYLHLARQWRILAADMMALSRGERI